MDLSKKAIIYNLKGFVVGNGVTDWQYDADVSMPETLTYFNLVPESYLDKWNNNHCHKYGMNVFKPTGDDLKVCQEIANEVIRLTLMAGIDPNNLFRPLKVYDENDRIEESVIDFEEKNIKKGFKLS